jgi:hypothetical protein
LTLAANLAPVSLTPVSTTQAELVAKLAVGVIDTSGKLAAAGVVDTGGVPWLAAPQIFEKIQNDPHVIFRCLGVRWKKPEAKNFVILSL